MMGTTTQICDLLNDSVWAVITSCAFEFCACRLQTFSTDRPVSAHDVITLKVKSEDGNHTFIVKMSSSETIGHLRQYLDKHRWDCILLHWQSICLYNTRHWLLLFSCVTEGMVLVMTSSVHIRSAAMTTNARHFNHVDLWLMQLCCCGRGNTQIHCQKSKK